MEHRAWRWMAALLLLGWAGCGGGAAAGPGAAAPATKTGEPVSDPSPPSEPEAFLEARAPADAGGDARVDARHRLRVALYGSEAWARFLDEPAHGGGDPAWSEDGGTVRAGLSEDAVRARLSALPDRPLSIDAPEAIAPVLEAALRVHLARLACERRRALLDADCEPPDTEAVDAEVRTLSMSVMLEPKYRGGLPLDDAGRPLRPATVVARRVAEGGGTEPVPGLPLRAELAEGGDGESDSAMLARHRATTDDDGEAAFPVQEQAPWPGALRIGVDAEGWLGPLARLWAAEDVVVRGRSTGLERWTALVTERVQGSGVRDSVFRRALTGQLRERGAGRPVTPGDDRSSRLESAIEHDRVERVAPNVADELGGELDVILVAQVDSEFASRMGTNRVWYEARGRLRVIDAWTGREVARVRASVTEAGVGDRRADRAARRRLAEELARKLFEAVEDDAVAAAG